MAYSDVFNATQEARAEMNKAEKMLVRVQGGSDPEKYDSLDENLKDQLMEAVDKIEALLDEAFPGWDV